MSDTRRCGKAIVEHEIEYHSLSRQTAEICTHSQVLVNRMTPLDSTVRQIGKRASFIITDGVSAESIVRSCKNAKQCSPPKM